MSSNCCKTKQSKNNLRQTAEFLKIISDSNRLQILCMLNKGERCVCEIWQYLDLPQNLISHHLKVLKDFKLVEAKKDGTKVIYSINQKIINKYSALLEHYLTK